MAEMDPTSCRIETLIGSLLCMMTAYRRNACRRLALSIAIHLDCLAHHPDADDSVRRIASGMCGEWKRACPSATGAGVKFSNAVH